ncbi:MAG: glycerol-3-phosphate 1-O-acyltransferase PlsY [bacterium]|uniref:Glycerol-3-phosphate acyltransferase n=2 Tax=Bacteria candidate phyla TaxID=1783234 RepID=A0A101I522_UNCT6|nr:MAG: Glycerol-3-phosphate acyltransferase [candidate division TA06 bacterium 32_111]KUK88095.1 MAG: Glycerol-3-phosphate acyltransferase [candidate division TA06 bacterium 34_109]MDI6700896.1 glycerol-3-phosphate 1-O-acyltransferase PlsY [bacterium]HAF07025.1 acyl-phosphate glycerol 3-phosphate acyltransferase [candidate division WOR-3 bacterium]HCP16939.1 acyl-phosphate glycerol 3-phosphate acyltransferase [candidate division WOR-3 bacterium]
MIIKIIIFCLLSYLFSGIPFAFVISKLFLKTDIRKVGSGNVGATNVYRIGGWKYGIPVFILDFLKGFIPTLISVFYFDKNLEISTIVAITTVLGHMFTPYLKFKGGKGAATSFGSFIVLFPFEILVCAIFFLISVVTTRIVAVGTIVSAFFLPIVYFVMGKLLNITFPFKKFSNIDFLLIIIVVIFIILKHKSNIERLIKGNENRI